MDVDRSDLLAGVLDDLAEGRTGQARDRLDAAWTAAADPVVAALASVVGFWTGDFAAASSWADHGLAGTGSTHPDDPGARALACAAAALAAAGDVDADGRPPWAEGTDLLARAGDDGRWWSMVRYLLAESALVSARLADARGVLAGAPASAAAWAGHRFAAMMRACDVRVAAFAGEITEAGALLGPMRESVVPGSRLVVVVEAVAGLVLGNADDADGVRRSIETSESAAVQADRDFIDRGVLLLLAFGAVAVGDVDDAARLVFRAGDDGDLGASTIIDRALGFEMLLVAALDVDDAAVAETWLAALAGLEGSAIAAPTVRRARARHLLAVGDVSSAIAELEVSIATCRREGRLVEAAEGEIVLARSRIAGADIAAANRDLRSLVSASDASGHHAVRRSATSALQATRRRLPPVAGGGWDVLSAREQQVARCVLDGLDIGEIAAALFLSPTTVRSHVSRVLCAFGVPTRIGLLAVAGPARPSPGAGAVAAELRMLSPRQAQVAALVAAGRSNQQIAEALGISVKGVEKHVGDILVRWSARSRFDVARTWWAVEGARTT
ncbi:LuxR C-terminal-related transcriptional regulator [Nocardioides caeni]|uniref:HTH luxR-type domain-containing protein n=1 Tax=Nocardioides caeni TaxID=574700 RepID=A0A4S8N2U8_9ACTN|nr:LuxR C-terminal-related transcriptional regulator [Nocardioides caeni]THV09074.1 hypothetical protein E9934_17340 [Nocardioides caeni]